jgi:aminoglycoside 3-N-acetyltransferase I
MEEEIDLIMNVTFRELTSSDINWLTSLIGVYETVFEMQAFHLPEASYLQTLLDNEQVIFYVACDEEGKVIGGLTAYMLPSVYYAASEVYIYDLAVEVEWQRKGVGFRIGLMQISGSILAGIRYCLLISTWWFLLSHRVR